MKTLTRQIFMPILKPLESGDQAFAYKRSHRLVLLAISGLFFFLAAIILGLVIKQSDMGYLLPVIIFSSAGLISLVVGSLGSDRAVAKIWGSR